MSLRAHLLEAIALNRTRRDAYEEMTGSTTLSTALIRLEQASLPIAAWLDVRSLKGRRRLLMEQAFVPMEVQPVGRPPRYRGGQVPRGLALELNDFARAVRRCLRRGDLLHVHALSCTWLKELERREQANGVHLAMSRHLVESIARTSAIAADLKLHRDALAPLLDRRAQRDHARGVGILVNDLPVIPVG